MEMNAVANMFDRNNEGYIDWKEFLAALRPDWEERPTTEDEIIHDEVKRQVQQCTCRNRFKVHQVGEGQYRVSLVVRLILRITVNYMVFFYLLSVMNSSVTARSFAWFVSCARL